MAPVILRRTIFSRCTKSLSTLEGNRVYLLVKLKISFYDGGILCQGLLWANPWSCRFVARRRTRAPRKLVTTRLTLFQNCIFFTILVVLLKHHWVTSFKSQWRTVAQIRLRANRVTVRTSHLRRWASLWLASRASLQNGRRRFQLLRSSRTEKNVVERNRDVRVRKSQVLCSALPEKHGVLRRSVLKRSSRHSLYLPNFYLVYELVKKDLSL